MSRATGELTATEWERMERARQRGDTRRAVGWRPPRPEDAVSHPSQRTTLNILATTGNRQLAALLVRLDVHLPSVLQDQHGAWLARCACGWEATSSWRLNDGVPMPEGYAWAEHNDHVRGLR
jgi:hypothetical protein